MAYRLEGQGLQVGDANANHTEITAMPYWQPTCKCGQVQLDSGSVVGLSDKENTKSRYTSEEGLQLQLYIPFNQKNKVCLQAILCADLNA